jgi:hypothetical protein
MWPRDAKNMIKPTPPIAKESGHYYCRDGTPCYEVKRSDGKGMRSTTLRDARKLNLVPSVTTICKLMDKPGLANWIAEQTIMAALTLPRQSGEADSDYIARIKEDSNDKRDRAAARGTALHTDIERWIAGKEHGHQQHILNIQSELANIGVELSTGISEKSFAHPDGFGGKCDFHNQSVILDFKSKDRIEEGKRLAWDEHFIQLASYSYGLGLQNPRCINVFVGVDDCKVVVVEHEPEDIARGLQMFKLLLAIWKLKNQI